MIPNRLWQLLAAAALLAVAGPVCALPSDRNQPISYQADRAERDNQAGTTTLEGTVIMQRGTIRIEADRVVIEDQDDKVSVIIATGSPARYRQIPAEGAEPVVASAGRVEYRLSEQSLHLINNASLVQGGSSLTGDRIDYDVMQSVVTAGSDELDQSERVRMVIPAKALQTADDPPAPELQGENAEASGTTAPASGATPADDAEPRN